MNVKADMILYNGKIHTGNREQPEVTAKSYQGWKIYAKQAGNDAAMMQLAGPGHSN